MTPRADAQRNRDRILEVAYAAFEADPEVSLNAIAKTAGVGAGTLYRHFPTREDLVLAVYRREIDALAERVEDVIAEQAPLDAFRTWFRQLATYVRLKHGLGEALQSASAQATIAATYEPVTTAIGRLLAAAEKAGEVRPGLDAHDVLQLMAFLWRLPDDPAGDAQADRILDLVVGGLRP